MLQIFLRAPGGGLRARWAQPGDSVASASGLEALTGPGSGLRVVCGGRPLDPLATLAEQEVPSGATLEVLPRVLGGGGDGGSTGAESRSCYLEMYAGKKADKVNPEEERLARWTTCQLSGMPLQPPCVADELGSLFNKDAVLQALLTKSMPKPLAHISSLKNHLIELKLGEAAAEGIARSGFNGGGSAAPANGGAAGGDAVARFACPITGQPFNGKYKFVIFRRTGHVLSERALKEVPKVVQELVGGKWDPAADLLPVNPTGDELQGMREALLLKRTAERAAKKEKKKDKAAAAAAANGGEAAAADGAAVAPAAGSKRPAENGGAPAAAAAGGAALDASAAAAAAKRSKVSELKPKGADDKVWNSLFTSSSREAAGGEKKGNTDYMCRAATRYVS